ncbi:MAG: hypothetical protein R3307_00020 [Anaerolineales bacterium]|nr:hypothetical protein [Anaerolineales bacterium]
MISRLSLRRIVKEATGQDVSKCQACFDCELSVEDELDIPLGSLIQLVLQNDEEALQSRTLWSDTVLEASRNACKRGLDLHAVITVLRGESKRRDGT